MKSNLILILVLFLFFGFTVKAQHASLSLGAEVDFPSGNSSNVSAVGLAAYAKAELGLSEKFSLTANGSIVNFFGKKFFGTKTPALAYLPVKGGLKYYTSENFYFEGQLGASVSLNDNSKTAFLWSPGVGTFLKTRGSSNKIDLGLRYEAWTSNRLSSSVSSSKYTTFSFIALRVGYAFAL